MEFRKFKMKLGNLIQQRNAAWSFAFLVLFINLFLSIKIVNLRSERIVLIPPEASKVLWVEPNEASSDYLSEMSIYLSDLLLNVNPESMNFQHNLFLKHVAPKSYGKIKLKLENQKKEYLDKQISTVFFPKKIDFDNMAKSISIEGQLSIMLGNSNSIIKEQTYRLEYIIRQSRFWVKSFESIKHV